MRAFYSDAEKQMEQREVSFVTDEHREFAQVKVYPNEEYQTVLGMGGAFTESSGYVYSLMNDEAKEKLIKLFLICWIMIKMNLFLIII